MQRGRLWIASGGCNQIKLLLGNSADCVECDLPAIGRPFRHRSPERRKCELQTLGAIYSTPPERTFRIVNIGDPLAVSGKVHEFGGNSIHITNELSNAGIELLQLAAHLVANQKERATVRAEGWRERTELSCSDADRTRFASEQSRDPRFFPRQPPDVGPALLRDLKYEVPSIGAPGSATYIDRSAARAAYRRAGAWQFDGHLPQSAPVARDFP